MTTLNTVRTSLPGTRWSRKLY